MVIGIGPAISVKKVEHPTSKQIDDLHAKYVAALRDIFDKTKHEMGPEYAKKRLYLETETIPKKNKRTLPSIEQNTSSRSIEHKDSVNTQPIALKRQDSLFPDDCLNTPPSRRFSMLDRQDSLFPDE